MASFATFVPKRCTSCTVVVMFVLLLSYCSNSITTNTRMIGIQPTLAFQPPRSTTFTHHYQRFKTNYSNNNVKRHTSSTLSLSFDSTELSSTMSSILDNFNSLLQHNSMLSNVENILNKNNIDISTVKTTATTAATTLSSSPTVMVISSIILILTISFQILSNPPPTFRQNYEPYARGQYNPQIASTYYSTKPLLVLRRLSQITRLSNSFILSLLIDKYIFRNEERNKEQKGQQLLSLIQNIGPTAIKVGQALSVRQDLIPDYYASALIELQDNVPPFDSADAVNILKEELGDEKFERYFKEIDFSKPVASASIGQVYKGRAVIYVDENGNEVKDTFITSMNKSNFQKKEIEVAVKVQRPNVLSEIALDLYLVREILAPLYQKVTNTQTNLQSLANEWGRGFIDELTYDREKRNTMLFNKQMKEKNLNAITAPTVIESLSTNRVLTTEWVDGTRLDKSQEDDVARLCGVALNAYLVMLLETGILHCDPHPGNLLRTKDGKLCILDFGMTLETPQDLQYSLLEFIAHLTAENYDDVPYDLVKLDFLKEEKVDLLVKTGALEPLYYFLRQANQGGGGSKVRERIFEEYRAKYPGVDDDELRQYMRQEIEESREQMAQKASAVTGVTMKVEDLQRENSDAFQIPEWFLYTSRAFLTLEGISLQADPDFSIVKSCFPYVAKRLLGDDSPRSQKALRDLIYGKDDDLNTDKISELADGFTKYTTTTKIVSEGKDAVNVSVLATNNRNNIKNDSHEKKTNRQSTEATITLVKDSADILLAPEGNLVQNLIVEESATAFSAQMKDTFREVLINNPERIRNNVPFGLGRFLPVGPIAQIEPFLTKSKKEEKILTLAQKLTSMINTDSINPPSAAQLGELIRSLDPNNKSKEANQTANVIENMSAEEIATLWKAIRENAPIYAPQVATLSGKFASSLLGKVSENIDTVIAKTSETEDLGDLLVRNSAKSISAAAKESVNALKPLISTSSKEKE